MKRFSGSIITICFSACIFACAAEAIDIYTFKKDRVDQELKGNRGYISGGPKDVPAGRRNLKRTLIGVDIELSSGPSGKDEKASSGREGSSARPARKEAPSRKEPVTVVGDEKEEEWIK